MYKLGKLPARKNSVTFKLAAYLKEAVVPAPPSSVSLKKYYPNNWGMLGNDFYGDCVWAGAAHETMLWNNEAKRSVNFSDEAVLSDYGFVTGFNPNDPDSDQGTDMQVAASYRRKVGVLDANSTRHKVVAYLGLDKSNVYQLKQAVYLFGAVGIGFNFSSTAMDQFIDGKPWTVKSGAEIEGGHYVPVIGYNKSYLYVVSWGRVQKMSWAFFRKYNDESVVYLSQEMFTNGIAVNGLNVSQLQADLQSL